MEILKFLNEGSKKANEASELFDQLESNVNALPSGQYANVFPAIGLLSDPSIQVDIENTKKDTVAAILSNNGLNIDLTDELFNFLVQNVPRMKKIKKLYSESVKDAL